MTDDCDESGRILVRQKRRSSFQVLLGLCLAAWMSLIQLRSTAMDYSHQPDEALPSPSISTLSFFDRAVGEAFSDTEKNVVSSSAATTQVVRRDFDVKTWNKTTKGGLTPQDRQMLGEVYRNASAVFEYGLGESTYIANYVGVERYAGVDSDPVWVAEARSNVSSHFRFYFADVGETKSWGYPRDAKLGKNVFQYQVAPLLSEPRPFDVYMVDGRWRLPCLMLSFLHASSRGADPADTIVLLHDCIEPPKPVKDYRVVYRQANILLDLVRHSGGLLCTYKRKPTTTDEDLWDMWKLNRNQVA